MSRRARLAIVLATALLAVGAGAQSASPVRVGTSGDYRPFSSGGDDERPLEGFDVRLVEAWAQDRGRALVWVRFAWPKLQESMTRKRFDFAASGITVRPERSAAGRFTVPIAETAPLVLARTPERFRSLHDLDRPSIQIAVNAGGHLERVARRRFPRASLIAVPDNRAVLGLLSEERVHAVVTDSVEATHWEAEAGLPLRRLGPLATDRKAWWVQPDRGKLARDLDAWLLEREADGTLARLRAEWLGDDSPATADPLGGLIAAIDERLALMPLVGVVKRRDGVALEVPEREAFVLDRAVADFETAVAAKTAALEAAGETPPEAPAPPAASAVRALFRAQIEAAKRVQWRAVKDPGYVPPALPDLDAALRPGLVRIGERITALILELPTELDPESVRARTRAALRAPFLDDELRDAIADAIVGCRETPLLEVLPESPRPQSPSLEFGR